MTTAPRPPKIATAGSGTVYLLNRKDRESRWMVAYFDVDGKRKTITADVQTEDGAHAHLRRLIHQRDTGESLASPTRKAHTLTTWLNEWLETKALQGARSRTIEAYRERITRHLLPRLGSKPLAKLTPDDIQAAYNAMLRTPSATTGRPLSLTTAHLVHNTLRGMLRAAHKRRLVGYVATERIEAPRRSRYEARTLTVPEARELLTSIADHRHGPMWTLMLGTGVRFGEAAGLKWSSVSLDDGFAHIHQQVTRIRTAGGPIVHELAPVKTDAGRRTIALPSFVVAALRIQQARNAAARAQAAARKRIYSTDPAHTDLVFPSDRGSLLHENHVLVAWHKALAAAGFEGQPGQAPLRMHDLRHTKGTLMADAGEDTTTIQRTLGHSSSHITADLYIGNTHNELKRAAQRYDNLFADDKTLDPPR